MYIKYLCMDFSKAYLILCDNKNIVKFSILMLCITVFLSGCIQNVLINAFVFTYLIFSTMRYIGVSSNGNENYNENKQQQLITVLQKWTIFAMIIVIESFLNLILSFVFMSIIYNTMKVISLIALFRNDDLLLLVWGTFIIPLFAHYDKYSKIIFEHLSDQLQKLQNAKSEKIDYSVYQYIKPYANKLWLFASNIKINGTQVKKEN